VSIARPKEALSRDQQEMITAEIATNRAQLHV
jgi:hypothetical protein